MKAVGYVRSAISDPEALAVQRSQVEGYCAGRGIDLVGFESDSGVSGLTMHRPGFRRLLKWLRNSRVGCIIMRDRSRLSRRYQDVIRYEQLFKQTGKAVLYVGEPKK